MSQPPPSTEASDSNLTAWLRRHTGATVNRVAQGFVRLGLTPNGLTIIGLLLSAISAMLAAQGKTVEAGLLYLLSGPFDALDGAVARASGKASPFGAILDSTLDRYGEAFLLTGIGYNAFRGHDGVGLVLCFVTLLGAVMVSYTRARSEGLGIDNKGGLLTRVERMILLGIGLLVGLHILALWALAVMTHITVGQRLWRVYRASQGNSPH